MSTPRLIEHCPGEDRIRGFSLLELLVSMAVLGLVSASILLMYGSAQAVAEDSADRISAQQSARMAFDWLQRDLLRAGVGYANIVAIFPLIVPRAEGGIELRYNPTGLETGLRNDMQAGESELRVWNVAGLVTGNKITVFDAAGNIEIFEITNVQANGWVSVDHSAATDFLVSEAATAADLAQIEYFVQGAGADAVLVRQLNGQNAQLVATGVVSMSFAYLDDADPPQIFTPADVAAQLRIRAVEVTLGLQAENRLDGGPLPVFTLASRVVPRVIALRAS